MKKISLTLAFMLSFATSASAFIAGADMAGGYSAQVLQKVLEYYEKPVDANGYAVALVRIAKDGRPFSCEMKVPSQSPYADEAICLAVAKAQQFPKPTQTTSSAEVVLTFVYDDTLPIVANTSVESEKSYTNAMPYQGLETLTASQTDKELSQLIDTITDSVPQSDLNLPENTLVATPLNDTTSAVTSESGVQGVNLPPVTKVEISNTSDELTYAQQIMENAKPHLVLPSALPRGIYTAKVRLKVDKNGELVRYSTVTSSGNIMYDDFLRKVLKTEGVIPVPKKGNEEVILTFSANK